MFQDNISLRYFLPLFTVCASELFRSGLPYKRLMVASSMDCSIYANLVWEYGRLCLLCDPPSANWLDCPVPQEGRLYKVWVDQMLALNRCGNWLIDLKAENTLMVRIRIATNNGDKGPFFPV